MLETYYREKIAFASEFSMWNMLQQDIVEIKQDRPISSHDFTKELDIYYWTVSRDGNKPFSLEGEARYLGTTRINADEFPQPYVRPSVRPLNSTKT